MLTINNPDMLDESIYSYDSLKKYIESKVKCDYFCYSYEIGLKEKTLHIHIFFYFKNPRAGNSLKKIFPTAHLDLCRGSCKQIRDYVFKENLSDDKKEKEDTRIEGKQYESATLPEEKQGNRSDLELLYDLIKQGFSNVDIYNANPSFIKYTYLIDKTRTEYLEDKYKKEWRDLEVIFVTGVTGKGKTRTVMEAFGYENVHRVIDYKHPFDDYKQQDVIIFEEFRNSLPIEQMLNFLDGYPVTLPSRYCNKVACYHKVFIITNWTLEEEYKNIQEQYPETWRAFLRRIHKIKIYNEDNIEEYTTEEYFAKQTSKQLEPIDENTGAQYSLFDLI